MSDNIKHGRKKRELNPLPVKHRSFHVGEYYVQVWKLTKELISLDEAQDFECRLKASITDTLPKK